ncbi:Uncharacterized protein TPAR_04552 [Tolypocladium paradoxum]|uniref:EKC/KEOPS complex subunit BUD32 n=1 Tax=Tolypocladium paradoxum TaxID=94208 RepID=A0A2S4KYK9_9HYPO|nr:Uncharacterized protein TPAR_04552 [Tolypocladium paradoxum]
MASPAGVRCFHRGEPFEEEELPSYRAENFYPVQIGHVFNSRYRVVAKLGFGAGSTVWLCRDQETNSHVALKLCTLEQRSPGFGALPQAEIEKAVSALFNSAQVEHPGIRNLRLLSDHFTVKGPRGMHQCLVYPPLGTTLTELRNLLPGRSLPKLLLQHTLLLVSLGLDLLHHGGVVHTDLSPNNVLLGVQDMSVFAQMEQAEAERPMARKAAPDRTIYGSRPLPVTTGCPVICDFGAARIGQPGQKYRGDVMPDCYRAPEVILDMEWDQKIDVWCVGLMLWDLFQGSRLFYALKD